MSTGGLSSNPIHCLQCNLEVPPARLGFDEDLVNAVAGWLRTYAAIDALELESRDYEQWARSELLTQTAPRTEKAWNSCAVSTNSCGPISGSGSQRATRIGSRQLRVPSAAVVSHDTAAGCSRSFFASATALWWWAADNLGRRLRSLMMRRASAG